MAIHSKTLIAAALAAAVGVATLLPASAFAQTAAVRNGKAKQEKPAMPVLRLKADRSNGDDAVAQLGNRIGEVAAHYGKTAQEFAHQLKIDRSANLDRDGRLMFVEQGATASGSDLVASGAVFPPEQTFVLHSRPSSKRKIYLDFNGHTSTGTAWNASYGLTPINSPAFDLDGVPGTFNAAELAMIQNIWRRVAEDYASFDVDVTTEEPPADLMTRSSTSDLTYGGRALITKNFTAGTAKGDCGCGGFAYVGVFDATSEYNKTAFVFQDKLGNSEKNIAEAVSHEVGHNLGLSHDGTTTVGYYRGHGAGATGWAPIMGVGYGKELVQFSKGEYLSANNKEDDYLIMQSNGVVFAADDFGNTIASATALSPTASGANNLHDLRGLIETPTDIDVFKFAAGAGVVTINATPFERSPNLDILIQLRDAAGNLVAESNPLATLNSGISVSLPVAGTYYLSVQGTGNGDPLGIGYSAYGSIGRYNATVSAPLAAAASLPAASISTSATTGAAPLTVTFSGGASTGGSSAVQSYSWNFGDGGTATGADVSHSYTAAGTFNATLQITNSAGQVDSKSVVITTTAPAKPKLYVEAMVMNTATSNNGKTYAQARVLVKNASGVAVPSAVVSGSWSGIVSGNSSVYTDANGVALASSNNSNGSGTFKFTVSNIVATGYAYDATLNKMTSNSVTK